MKHHKKRLQITNMANNLKAKGERKYSLAEERQGRTGEGKECVWAGN